MLCYPCATRGVERPAVALCRSCSTGLCLEHLRETAARLAPNPLAGCHHDTWHVDGSPRPRHAARDSWLRVAPGRVAAGQPRQEPSRHAARRSTPKVPAGQSRSGGER
jgi:hypothetical protein